MQRPGNLRGIGKLGHWQLGAYINPTTAIRTDSSLWKIQPITTSPTALPPQIIATPNPTGYTLTSPSVSASIPATPTPIISSSPPPAPVSTTSSIPNIVSSSSSAPPVITTPAPPTPAPSPSIATLISSSGTTPTPTPSIATLISSSGPSSSAAPDSSTPAASTEAPLPVLETRYSYAVPVPGYNYPLPGIETYPGLTPQYTTAAPKTITKVTSTSKYFWDKPGVKFLAVIVLATLVFKKDIF